MQLGCFGFHRQIYPQEGDSKKKWKIEIFGKFDMPTTTKVLLIMYTLLPSDVVDGQTSVMDHNASNASSNDI